MGIWDYMNSLAGGGGSLLGNTQSPFPTGGGLPQFPRFSGNPADFLRGWQNARPLSPKQPLPLGSFSPFSLGGVPQFFNPANLGPAQPPAPIRAQSWADRSGTLNTGVGDMFGGGRMRPQAYTPNPYIRRMMPQRTPPNLPNLPPMNWGGGYNGGF